MILPSVDLPAPFSPTSACTSPGRKPTLTSSSARVAPNRLPSPSVSTTGEGTGAPACAPSTWIAMSSASANAGSAGPLPSEVRLLLERRLVDEGGERSLLVRVHNRRHRLLLERVDELLEGLLALRDGEVDVVGLPDAVAHRLDRLLGASGAGEVHALRVNARVLQSELCARRLLIGVGEQDVDLRVGLERVLHGLQRLIPVVVAFKRGDDLDVRVLLEDL